MSEGFGYEANLQRGTLLRQSGRFEDACRFLGEAIQADPEQPQAYLELALALSCLPGKRAESLAAIERAVALDPHTARTLGYKAYLLSHFGRHQEALEVGKRALELDPGCYIALLAHANAHTKLAQWYQAETFSRRILALFPQDTSALNLLAQSLRFQRRTQESRDTVAQILALVPNDSFGHTNAGYEALNVDDFRRAEVHFRDALSRDPTFEHARKGLLQSFRMRSWFYRANYKILNFFEEKRGWPTVLKVLMIWLSIATFGLFFGVILIYLLLSLAIVPLSNLFLMADPTARRIFNRKERRNIWLIGLAVIFVLAGTATEACHGIPWPLLLVLGYLAQFGSFLYLPQWREEWRARRAQSKSACAPRSPATISGMAGLLDKFKALFSSPAAEIKPTGLIGAQLSGSLQTHDLFGFFNFAAIGKETLSEQRVATAFKPTGESFHDLVTLYITTDARDLIQVMRLVIVRSFIDNPSTCIYAADLAKSFLYSVNPDPAEDKMAALAREISARSMGQSSRPMITARELPRAEGEPSAAYRTYQGQGPAQTLFNSRYSIQLLLQNDLRAQPPSLEMILSAKARRPA